MSNLVPFQRHAIEMLPQPQVLEVVKPITDSRGYYRYEKYSKESVLEIISFGVSKKALWYKDLTGQVHQSSAFSIIRNDNGRELGTVSDQYQIVKHEDVLEPALTALSDLDYTFKTVAMKNDGGKVADAKPEQLYTRMDSANSKTLKALELLLAA